MKIYIQTPFERDANSFWRCVGPLSYLSKASRKRRMIPGMKLDELYNFEEVEIHVGVDGQLCTWAQLDKFDLIFMHRPCRPDDLTVLKLARNLNIPVWVDYDDWLFQIPDWNLGKKTYNNLGIQNIMATCLACADVVTTSTTALYKEFLTINPNTVLVPNAYRSDLFPYRGSTPPVRQNIAAWRGTNTHEGDLLSVMDALTLVDQKIHFMGGPPWSVLSRLQPEKYVHHEMNDPLLYWRSFYDLAPRVLLFPLYDLFFNHCKSNIAWIEALHAGCLVIAPEGFAEWNHPGVIKYKSHDSLSFLGAIESVFNMHEDDYQSSVKTAYDYMRNKYDISVINKIRFGILNSIFSTSFVRNKRDPYNQLTGMWALSVLSTKPLPRIGENENQPVQSGAV